MKHHCQMIAVQATSHGEALMLVSGALRSMWDSIGLSPWRSLGVGGVAAAAFGLPVGIMRCDDVNTFNGFLRSHPTLLEDDPDPETDEWFPTHHFYDLTGRTTQFEPLWQRVSNAPGRQYIVVVGIEYNN